MGLAFDAFDAFWPEARPVFVIVDDDRRLQMAEHHDKVARSVVGTDVDGVVRDAGLVERASGCSALHAVWLGVHGDHFDQPSF